MCFQRQEPLYLLKILTALCLGMAAAFATGPAFAGEKETSPIAATSATSPNDSKTTDLAGPNANHNLPGELAGPWNYVLKISMGRTNHRLKPTALWCASQSWAATTFSPISTSSCFLAPMANWRKRTSKANRSKVTTT
jgi:hypothetical protein